MITFFTTGKAFAGHTGVIQRNALKSWTLLHPDVEVILFGDDAGAAETTRELGIRHEPRVDMHECGMKFLHSIFARADQLARNEHLCYANCDIVLMQDFWNAFQIARRWKERFLLTGHRWDTDVFDPIAFDSPDWSGGLRAKALEKGFRQLDTFVDFFTVSKGLYANMPPLVIGRSYWDHWFVWEAIDSGVPAIDCTAYAVAVHQNHDYGYHPAGKIGTHADPVAMRNLEFSGGPSHQRHLAACTHAISANGKIKNTWARRALYSKVGHCVWGVIVRDTFWLRQRLGLRRETLSRLVEKLKHFVGNTQS